MAKKKKAAPKKKAAAKAGVTGIDHLYLATKDYATAWKFWTEIAGGTTSAVWGDAEHRAGIVNIGKTGLVVAQERSGGEKAELGYDIVYGRPQVFLKCDGIDAVYKTVRARGAKIVSTLHQTHWGPRAFSVEGPDAMIVSFLE